MLCTWADMANSTAQMTDSLGIEDAQLCEDAHVSSFQTNATLHESNELIIVATLLVELADLCHQKHTLQSQCEADAACTLLFGV